MATFPGDVDDAAPLEPPYCPAFRASSDDVDANVEEDAALVPELNEGAESDDEDAEFDTPELVREAVELDAVVPPARGAETLLVWGALPTDAV